MVPQVVATVTGVNMKTVGTGILYTVPAGYKFVTVEAKPRPTVISGLVSIATLGVGIAAGEIDIIPATPLTGLDAITKAASIKPALVSRVALAGEVIKYGVTVGVVGTTYTADIDLIGYLMPA